MAAVFGWVVLFLLCAWGLPHSTRQLQAEFHALYAKATTQSLEGRRAHINSALRYRPLNAGLHEMAADIAGSQNNYPYALSHRGRALALLPTSPHHWFDYARDLMASGDFSENLSKSLSRAVTLGPYERAMHYQLTLLAMRWAHRMNPQQRQILRYSVQLTWRYQRANLQQDGKEMRRLDALCGHYAQVNPDLDNWCANLFERLDFQLRLRGTSQ